MTLRRFIILMLMLLGLVAYVYFFEVQGEKHREARKNIEQQVIQIDVSQVTGLSFLPDGIEVQRINSQWRIQSPVMTEADSLAVATILDALRWMKKGRFVTDNPHDLPRFGLNPYQNALVIRQGDRIDSLFVGDSNLDGSECYYRNASSHQVFLVPISLKTSAAKTLFDLRDKSIVTFAPKHATRVLIANRGKNYQCDRDRNWRWRLSQPIVGLADEDRIDAMLNQMADSKVKGFASELNRDLGRYGLDRPWLTIALYDSAGLPLGQLEVGNQQDAGYYARNVKRPGVVLIDSALVAQLNVSLYDLRDKTIAFFQPDSVTSIWVEQPEFIFHCRKDSAGRWYMLKPDSALARSWKINSLLYRLKDLKVARFVDPPFRSDPYYGFDSPAIRVKLMNDNRMVTDLAVGKAVDDKVYLKNQVSNMVYLVEQQAKRELSIVAADFIDK